MKRGISIALTAMLVATAGVLLPTHALTASAQCGWNYERTVYGSIANVYDINTNSYSTADYGLITYQDFCGHKYYSASVSLDNPYYAVQPVHYKYLEVTIRVWVCGTYQGYWEKSLWTTTAQITVTTPSFFYGLCGRQADNGYTEVAGSNLYPTPDRLYLNQG